jgi:hypothetical protein
MIIISFESLTEGENSISLASPKVGCFAKRKKKRLTHNSLTKLIDTGSQHDEGLIETLSITAFSTRDQLRHPTERLSA